MFLQPSPPRQAVSDAVFLHRSLHAADADVYSRCRQDNLRFSDGDSRRLKRCFAGCRRRHRYVSSHIDAAAMR